MELKNGKIEIRYEGVTQNHAKILRDKIEEVVRSFPIELTRSALSIMEYENKN